MTVDYRNTAAYLIRGYVWENLQNDGILNPDDYIADGFTKPLVPLIPMSDVPQFKNLVPGAPYIIWDFSVNGYSEDFWICEEEMTFSVIHNDRNKIVEITMYLVDLLRRMDVTAAEVEEFEYNSLLDNNGNLTAEPKFNFYNIYINNINNTPEIDEGDIMVGEVWIRYKYSRRIGENYRFI